MTESAPTDLDAKGVSHPSFFRYRKVGERYVVTNLAGEYAVLSADDFAAFSEGTLDRESDAFLTLRARSFIRDEIDPEDLRQKAARRKRFVGEGPGLHIVVVTGRCNETCVYCHASRHDLADLTKDMTAETADATVDLIFETTSSGLTIEFQGGEPLVNFDIVQRIVARAKEKNERAGKALDFTLVSNLAAMDDEKLEFLMENRVQVCTSIDGPPALHNKQRILPGGDSFTVTEEWIKKINQGYIDRGLDPETYHVEALLTTTKGALSQPTEIVDVYRSLGCRAIYLRPLDPFGFASRTKDKVGYSTDEYLAFYRQAFAHIVELNRQGHHILERYAAIFLTKILTGDDPGFLDIRSPCGAGIGQVAYNYDGGIFTCDEGRMVHEMGDDIFRLGSVHDTSYQEAVGHPTVRALITASTLDGVPSCATCAYNPYCGICPVHNYTTQGSIHGQMPTSTWCQVHMGIQDLLFEYIAEGDQDVLDIFDRWVTVKPRDFYVQ